MEINFWQGFFHALDCEYKEINELKGISGITHEILCLGIDHKQKRIIIAQNEQDARVLAMVQADIQAKIKDYNVLMIRPVPINLASAFTTFSFLLGSYKFTQLDIESLAQKERDGELGDDNKAKMEQVLETISPQIKIISKTKLNFAPIFKELVQQLSHIKFFANIDGVEEFAFDFGDLINFNPIIYDTALGICPIPLYDFTEQDTESFFERKDVEQNKYLLEKYSIRQFFYPPIDSLALGLIESGKYIEKDLIATIEKVPEVGHPYGENEFLDLKNINDVVEALKEKGLAVEGEVSLELTENGIGKRVQVKFAPRESIFKRIANIFSLKAEINLKDLFK